MAYTAGHFYLLFCSIAVLARQFSNRQDANTTQLFIPTQKLRLPCNLLIITKGQEYKTLKIKFENTEDKSRFD